ncbi:hypothetical protein C0J52_24336 [Blattella germanica]|nr:hypothetical protein C0J52_24336 [Blattella germanica]
MAGNPCAGDEETDFRQYVCAFLPKLTYYEYRIISSEERQKANGEYRSVLEQIEEKEGKLRQSKEEEAARNKELAFHAEAYVENLDEIFKIGLEHHDIREEEIKQFQKCVDAAKEDDRVASQEKEIERSRKKIIEINHFLDVQREEFEEFSNFQLELPDSETASEMAAAESTHEEEVSSAEGATATDAGEAQEGEEATEGENVEERVEEDKPPDEDKDKQGGGEEAAPAPTN